MSWKKARPKKKLGNQYLQYIVKPQRKMRSAQYCDDRETENTLYGTYTHTDSHSHLEIIFIGTLAIGNCVGC